MDYKNILVVAVAVLVSVALSGVLFGGSGVGSAGPTSFSLFTADSGLVWGGQVISTSTDNSTATLLASDLYNPTTDRLTSRLEVTPNSGNLTLTLPASSSLAHVIPNNGDSFSFVLENEATAATTTTIAAGSGMDLQEPDGQNVVIGQNNFAVVTMQRDENGDFIVWVDETIPAD